MHSTEYLKLLELNTVEPGFLEDLTFKINDLRVPDSLKELSVIVKENLDKPFMKMYALTSFVHLVKRMESMVPETQNLSDEELKKYYQIEPKDRPSEELVNELKSVLDFDFNIDDLLKQKEDIKVAMDELLAVLERVKNNEDTEEDIEFMKKEIEYQYSKKNHPDLFNGENGQATYEEFKKKYIEWNNPQPQHIPETEEVMNGDNEEPKKECCGDCSGCCDEKSDK